MKTSTATFLRKGWTGMLLLLLLPTIHVAQSTSQPPHINWITQDGRDNGPADTLGVEWSWDIRQTSDGGYISCGFTNLKKGGNTNPNSANTIPAIIKLGPHGQTQWIEYFSGNEPELFGFFTEVIETNEGYVAVGRKRVIYNGNIRERIHIVKVDFKGNKLEEHFLFLSDLTSSPQETGNLGASIQKVPSGGYIIGGVNNVVSTGENWNILMLKVDDNFEYEWHYELDHLGYRDRILSVVLTYSGGTLPDGTGIGTHNGYAFAGYVGKDAEDNPGSIYKLRNFSDKDGYIGWLDLNGNMKPNWPVLIDSKTYDTTWYDYIETGSCSPTPAPSDTSFYRNSQDEIHSIIQLSDGHLAVSVINNKIIFESIVIDSVTIDWACESNTLSGVFHGEYLSGDVGIVKIDTANPQNLIFNKNVAHFAGDDWIPKIRETYDNGLVIVGTTAHMPNFPDYPTNLQQPMLIKMENILGTSPSPTIPWRRTIGWSQSGGMCGFGVTVCNDGGYAICGNNNEFNENWQFVKLYSDCQPSNFNINGDDDLEQLYIYSNSQLSGKTYIVKDFITVKSTGTLTISNSTLKFADTRQLNDYEDLAANGTNLVRPKIIVEHGGTLIINNSTLKGLSSCGHSNMWEGIEVHGYPNQGASGQGKVILNNATIEDAIHGIRINKGKYNANGHPTGVYTPFGGGIFQIDNGSTFLNCREAIKVTSYPYSKTSGTTSYIKNSFFKTTDVMADPDYVSVDLNDLTSSLHGVRRGVDNFISLWDIHGLDILGNTFDNLLTTLPVSLKGVGIGSIDASYKITKGCTPLNTCTGPLSIFKDLEYGVSSLNVSGVNAIEIDRTNFINCHRGVNLSGIDLAKITRNSFKVPPAAGMNYSYGAYLYECTQYEFAGNEFWSTNGGFSGSWIHNEDVNNNAFANLVEHNTYRDISFASAGNQENRGNNELLGLVFKCNDYQDNGFDIFTVNNPGISENQGDPSSSNLLAGNIFDGCSSSVFPGELYNSAMNYTYHHHSDTDRTPTPGCYWISTVTPLDGLAFFNELTDCLWEEDGGDGGGGGGDDPNFLKSEIFAYDAEILNLESQLTGEPEEDAPIIAQINLAKRLRQLTLAELVRGYFHDSSLPNHLDSAIMVLGWESSPQALSQLISFQIQAGHFNDATDNLAVLEQESGWTEFIDLQEQIISFNTHGGNIWDMETNPTLKAEMEAIAADHTHSGSIHARAALDWVFGEKIEEVIVLPTETSRQARPKVEEQLSEVEKPYHLHAYPNPFSNNVLVEITTEKAGKLRLIDMLGRVIQEVEVLDGEQSLKLNGASLIPGIYSCQLLVGGKIVAHELMVKS